MVARGWLCRQGVKHPNNASIIFLVLDTGHEVLDTVAGGSVWQ